MDGIVKNGDGFLIWSHPFEEIQKATLTVYTKGVQDWSDGDSEQKEEYTQSLFKIRSDPELKKNVKHFLILDPSKKEEMKKQIDDIQSISFFVA